MGGGNARMSYDFERTTVLRVRDDASNFLQRITVGDGEHGMVFDPLSGLTPFVARQ